MNKFKDLVAEKKDMDLCCKDCKFYLPVDVFRGLCKMTGKNILPEDVFCTSGSKAAKCRFCLNYSSEKEYLGKCRGNILAYPDMLAVNCTDFLWLQQN